MRDIRQIGAAIDSQGVALVSDISAADAIMSGQLVPLTDRWLASGNGSGAGRPRRDGDEFPGWMTDELVFEVASST